MLDLTLSDTFCLRKRNTSGGILLPFLIFTVVPAKVQVLALVAADIIHTPELTDLDAANFFREGRSHTRLLGLVTMN